MLFENKTVLITGGTRGIGKAIGIRLAKEGANIVIVGKTADPHPKLEGTIYTAAEEIAQAGPGKVLPLQGDIRFEESIDHIVKTTLSTFGGIDVLINNASAINLFPTEQMEAKRFDLMHSINVRGTFLMSKACIPSLKKAHNPHILNLSPPLNMDPNWFGKHLAYTMSKYGMSMIVLGLAEELKTHRIAANALWPKLLLPQLQYKTCWEATSLSSAAAHPKSLRKLLTILCRDLPMNAQEISSLMKTCSGKRASLTFPGMPSTPIKN